MPSAAFQQEAFPIGFFYTLFIVFYTVYVIITNVNY